MNSKFISFGQKKAFTLIELLTVIAIIGILAAIIIPTVGAVKKSANKAKTKVQFTQWAASIELFKQEYGYYPDIGTSNKLDPGKFFAAMTAKDYAGTALSGNALNGNKRKMSFYSVSDTELVKNSSGAATNEIVDAFGNSTIAVFLDTDLDGIVIPTASNLNVGNSVDGSVANTTGPVAADFPATGVRAGVVFYSAGYGASSSDYVLSWK
jgi:prepilin-type N-terminal cleavage/methylation domain-containing protein